VLVDVVTSVVVVVATTVFGVQSGHVVVVFAVVVAVVELVGVDVVDPVEVGYVCGTVDVGCEYPASAAGAQPVSTTSRPSAHRFT
jgi:hypothetical protein